MASSSRRLEVHRKPIEAPASDTKIERDELLRDCRLCKSEHALRRCLKFRKLSVRERWETVKRLHYCFNCLAHSHMRDKCTSRERCAECMAEHHTLLHRHRKTAPAKKPTQRADDSSGNSSNITKRNRRRRRNREITRSSDSCQHRCCRHPHQHAQQQQQRQPMETNSQAATIVINVMSGRVV